MKKVWVNGTFDIIHIGHIKLLEYASKFGVVRVGLDTDERVKNLKGLNRPYNNLSDRLLIMNSIKYVNDVVSFGTDDELINEIKKYEPDYMIIGNDYINKKIIGRDYIPEIIYFVKIENQSTTNILEYEKNISNRL